MAKSDARFNSALWVRVLIFIIFIISVCLLAGYVAVEFRYPSLFNVKASFAEYAFPHLFSWALIHLPSMAVYGSPLLFLPKVDEKYTRYFRIFCIVSFLLLLLEFDEKIPFLLFPKIDALVALALSFFILPPNRKDNPLTVAILKGLALLGFLIFTFFAYSFWSHQTPVITETEYGVFKLKSITVNNDFRKEMLYEVDMKSRPPEEALCELGQKLAHDLLEDYPFDHAYLKKIEVTFRPNEGANLESYQLGEISLREKHKEKDGRFGCSLRYRD